MSVAYNSKTLTYPGLELQDILLYNNTDKLRDDCKSFGLTLANGNIQFDKSKFNDETKLVCNIFSFNLNNKIVNLNYCSCRPLRKCIMMSRRCRNFYQVASFTSAICFFYCRYLQYFFINNKVDYFYAKIWVLKLIVHPAKFLALLSITCSKCQSWINSSS